MTKRERQAMEYAAEMAELPDLRPAWWDNESESVYSEDPEDGYPYDE